jgi:anhydro-N-acetylmuramic acid kinase
MGSKKYNYIAGFMSGSSADGLDVCVCVFGGDNVADVLYAATIAYDAELKQNLIALLDDCQLSQVIRAEMHYTQFLAQVATELLQKYPQIQAIGVHGHTVYHQPQQQKSWQLVNALRLTELIGCPVISDFRSRDIALGGEGAPLAPLFHKRRFWNGHSRLAVVNVGGIANVTLMAPNQPILGYDIGPGNALLDLWISDHLGLDFDANGSWSKTGSCIETSLQSMLRDPYFKRPAPKSTHRDYFNRSWLMQHISPSDKPEDVQATLLALTAYLIVEHVRGYDEIIIVGGGAKNKALIELIARAYPTIDVQIPADADFFEAHLMAWLASERLAGNKLDYTQITGAGMPTYYGEVFHPSTENNQAQHGGVTHDVLEIR